MPLQKTVHARQALAMPGMFYDATPHRVTAYDAAPVAEGTAVIGRVCTFGANGKPQLGGTGHFAGIVCHPAALARSGLDATLTIRDGACMELADMGRIVVTSTQAAKAGGAVQYNTTTGEITGTAPDAPSGGMATLSGATFCLFDAAAGEPAVVQLR